MTPTNMTELEAVRARKAVEAEAVEKKQSEELSKLLPNPVGYRLLIALPNVKETFGASGLVKSEITKSSETIMTMVGMVLDMGGQAYTDKERYPTGPWCKRGDHVMFRANTGTRFKILGKEFRLINDDSVEAVVPDPFAVGRV